MEGADFIPDTGARELGFEVLQVESFRRCDAKPASEAREPF